MAELIPAVAALGTTALTIGAVITKLVTFLQNEKSNLMIKEDVKRLNKELEWMRSFLLDAEKKHNGESYLYKTWVGDVSQIANECNDVAEKIHRMTMKKPKMSLTGCLSLSYCISYKTSYKLKKEVNKLLSGIREIVSRRNCYYPNLDAGSSSGIKSVHENLMTKRRTTPYANNELMVGHDETIKKLTTKLMNKDSDEFVISIVGTGGLGKTTLARKLFNTLSEEHFTSRGWIYVSEKHNTKDILMSLINSMTKPSREEREVLTDIDSMEAHLRRCLNDRCFLVVVDDVWDAEAWESLQRAFPDNNNGSKVIITTRNVRVTATAYTHELRYLDEDESWILFCRNALPRDKECPPKLKEVGKKIVSKCGGLPQAIIELGRILSRKPPTLLYWKDVSDNHPLKLLEDESAHINKILTLSFMDLPQHLQQCFKYVAMFPEDFEIPISRLMLLWEAEDFTDGRGYREDATKSYFNELVGRSLFSKTGGDWIESTFQVHDLLRELAIRKSREMSFSIYYDGKETRDILNAPPHRRLAVFHPQNEIPDEYTNPSLHTLRNGIIPTGNVHDPSSSSQLPYEKFGLLRVLDIEIPTTKSISSDIGKLIHLRFLGFQFKQSDDTYRLPDTIQNLLLLQTLSIPSGMVRLPATVLNLTKVKHLIGNFIFLRDEIGSLVGLETLAGISSEQWCRLDTTKLLNLRRLKLWSIKKVDHRFYDNFKNLGKLQTLTLEWELGDVDSDINLEKIFELCPRISHLETRGISFRNALCLDSFAENLEVLECVFYGAEINDSISSIGKLSQLKALHVRLQGTGGSQICFSEGFAQVKTLKIMSSDPRFRIEEGCLPLLNNLLLQSNNV